MKAGACLVQLPAVEATVKRHVVQSVCRGGEVRRRAALPGPALVAILFLAACWSSAGTASSPAPASAVPNPPASSAARLPMPIRSTLRDSGAGGVTVEATWLGRQDDGGLAFRVTFDTHSVDLSRFDVAVNLVLHDERGQELRASGWQDERRDSHHRAGIVRFPGLPSGGAASRVTLVVHNLAGVAERALIFEFQG